MAQQLTAEVNSNKKLKLEAFFKQFRDHIIGNNTSFTSVYGKQKLLYTDWIASGRLYRPIEDTMCNVIGPMVANTHSFSSETGKAYKYARQIIKEHVNANDDDILITTGTGMTGALARLHRIMGLRWPDTIKNKIEISESERPVVFITHMEHHSNHVSWMETIADVVIVGCDEHKLVCPDLLAKEVKKYTTRKLKIGAFTACSNVTGIITPYQKLAKVMHQHGGIIIADFAASAPYVAIDMHPEDKDAYLDAPIYTFLEIMMKSVLVVFPLV